MKKVFSNSILIGSFCAFSAMASAAVDFNNVNWTQENASNVAENDDSGCALSPSPSTSSSASFDFGLTNDDDDDCLDSSTQRDEFKYERREGYTQFIGYFTLDGDYQNFDKMGIAQTHDDSNGSGGVFSIYQIRQSDDDGVFEFGVQGDTTNVSNNGYSSHPTYEGISFDTRYKLVIQTYGANNEAYEKATLYNSNGTELWSDVMDDGGEELQYKKIGAYQLTGGTGPFYITWEDITLYTGD